MDDNAAFLDTARRLLESEGLRVVAVASDRDGALAGAQASRPDVALVDVDLGPASGLTVARELAAAQATLQIILISAYPAEDLPGDGDEPAFGFIPKSSLSRRAIERALA